MHYKFKGLKAIRPLTLVSENQNKALSGEIWFNYLSWDTDLE